MMEFLWELACQLHPAVEVCHLARTEGERLLTSEETFKMTERISKAERLLGRKVNETIGNLTSNVSNFDFDFGIRPPLGRRDTMGNRFRQKPSCLVFWNVKKDLTIVFNN
jgi:hypothetical protein